MRWKNFSPIGLWASVSKPAGGLEAEGLPSLCRRKARHMRYLLLSLLSVQQVTVQSLSVLTCQGTCGLPAYRAERWCRCSYP